MRMWMRVHAGLAKQALVACGLLCGGGVKGGNVISTTRGAVQIKRHKKPKPNADENAGHVGLPCCVSVSCTVTATAVSCICVSLLPPCPSTPPCCHTCIFICLRWQTLKDVDNDMGHTIVASCCCSGRATRGRGTLMLASVLTLLLSCRRRRHPRRHLHPRAKVAFYCRRQLLRLVAVVVVVVVACTSLMQISICVRQQQQQQQ